MRFTTNRTPVTIYMQKRMWQNQLSSMSLWGYSFCYQTVNKKQTCNWYWPILCPFNSTTLSVLVLYSSECIVWMDLQPYFHFCSIFSVHTLFVPISYQLLPCYQLLPPPLLPASPSSLATSFSLLPWYQLLPPPLISASPLLSAFPSSLATSSSLLPCYLLLPPTLISASPSSLAISFSLLPCYQLLPPPLISDAPSSLDISFALAISFSLLPWYLLHSSLAISFCLLPLYLLAISFCLLPWYLLHSSLAISFSLLHWYQILLCYQIISPPLLSASFSSLPIRFSLVLFLLTNHVSTIFHIQSYGIQTLSYLSIKNVARSNHVFITTTNIIIRFKTDIFSFAFNS